MANIEDTLSINFKLFSTTQISTAIFGAEFSVLIQKHHKHHTKKRLCSETEMK